MKKLIYFAPLLLFSSCILNQGKNEFIVEQISQIEDNSLLVKYQIQAHNMLEFEIIDSIGRFQVGDTLKLTK